ncbi:MAG: hypothetical protein J6Y78_10260 [Paludibacteraceae bacterium]|nr:hypothetical protein [Paludibacteraceae bacterium]
MKIWQSKDYDIISSNNTQKRTKAFQVWSDKVEWKESRRMFLSDYQNISLN